MALITTENIAAISELADIYEYPYDDDKGPSFDNSKFYSVRDITDRFIPLGQLDYTLGDNAYYELLEYKSKIVVAAGEAIYGESRRVYKEELLNGRWFTYEMSF